MSKKVVAFTLPPSRTNPADSASKETPASSPRGQRDTWVLDALKPKPAEPREPSPIIIDLSANRSWIELVQLICIFPYLATSAWMHTATKAWLGSVKQR
jgi:hypothetical protein